MTDRFTLEEEIMKCWNVVEDIDLLYKTVIEKDLSKDELQNYLLGLKIIYSVKFDNLFSTFESLIASGDIT